MFEWVLNTPLLCAISKLLIISIIGLLTCLHLARLFLMVLLFILVISKYTSQLRKKMRQITHQSKNETETMDANGNRIKSYLKRIEWKSFKKLMQLIKLMLCNIQKQPPRGVLKKRCSENIPQIYRRTPMLKCDFNKVALDGCFCLLRIYFRLNFRYFWILKYMVYK